MGSREMRTTRTPAILLAFLYVCFLTYLISSAPQLPDKVATHFGAGGRPDGWMSRTAHLLFMAAFGLAFPFFLVGLFYILRFMPDSSFNLPRRDYWLAPERRAETFAYLLRHSLWFACLAVCLVIGLHFL